MCKHFLLFNFRCLPLVCVFVVGPQTHTLALKVVEFGLVTRADMCMFGRLPLIGSLCSANSGGQECATCKHSIELPAVCSQWAWPQS